MDAGGRLVHASQMGTWGGWATPFYPAPQSEVENLKNEKANLEARLREIEEKLKNTES
jgi:hypothetical protein